MNITTSLELKSPGIFVGIACALQEETPPLSTVLLLHSVHRTVHVPTRTCVAKLHQRVTVSPLQHSQHAAQVEPKRLQIETNTAAAKQASLLKPHVK